MATFGQTDAASMRAMAGALENGGADVAKIGRGVALLLKYQAEVVENGFVTPAECEAMHKHERTLMKQAVEDALEEKRPTVTLPWAKIAGTIGVPTPLLAFVYLVGQAKGWW